MQGFNDVLNAQWASTNKSKDHEYQKYVQSIESNQ